MGQQALTARPGNVVATPSRMSTVRQNPQEGCVQYSDKTSHGIVQTRCLVATWWSASLWWSGSRSLALPLISIVLRSIVTLSHLNNKPINRWHV